MSAGWLLALVVIGCLLAAFTNPAHHGGYRGGGKPWSGDKPPKTPASSSVSRREEDYSQLVSFARLKRDDNTLAEYEERLEAARNGSNVVHE